MYIAKMWDLLKQNRVRGRVLIAAVFLFISLISGTLTVARETISDYQLISADEAAAAQYIEENTPQDAVVLCGTQHNNPVAALTGRYIICGTSSYLYFHGVDYSQQEFDLTQMLEHPGDNLYLLEQYEVSFVYISSWERASFDVDEDWFSENCELVFESGDVVVYKYSSDGE